MKRKFLILSFTLLLLVSSTTISYSSTKIIESPDIRIVIDGKSFDINSIPILMNGRTLLPLTDVASAFGIPNDKQHIIWDSAEKSISIIKDSSKIIISINKNKALINNKEIKTDVCPIIYKDRTYIPLSLIGNCFERKVVWEGNSKTIAICSSDEYNSIKSIIEKCVASMNALRKYELIQNGNSDYEYMDTGETSKTHSNLYEIWDIDKRILSLSYNDNLVFSSGGSTSFDNMIYTADGKSYTKSGDNPWKLDTSIETQKNDVFKNDFGKLFDKSIYYSGLRKTVSSGLNDIILEGDVITMSESDKYDRIINCHTKIVIDINNYFIKQMTAFSNTISRFEGEDYLKHYTDYDSHYNKLDDKYEIPNPVDNN